MEQMGTYKKGEELMHPCMGGGGRGMWVWTSVETEEGRRGVAWLRHRHYKEGVGNGAF